ncbi:MAG: hypothetical protein LBI04_06895 [Treponema sp.]|nr:hypothetical protein [Treponema sp.]
MRFGTGCHFFVEYTHMVSVTVRISRPLEFPLFLYYYKNMKQTVTLEVENITVMQLLRNLAEMSLVKFTLNQYSSDDLIIAQINEVCKEADTSLAPSIMAAQMEVLEGDAW